MSVREFLRPFVEVGAAAVLILLLVLGVMKLSDLVNP